MTPLTPIVDEFVKHSPAAWQAMCHFHRAQAIGRLGGYFAACFMFLLFSRALVPTLLRRTKDRDYDTSMGGGLSLFILLCAGIALVAWGSVEMPSAWGTAFAPERDAAVDVIHTLKGSKK